MRRAVFLSALFVSACASSQAAPIAYGTQTAPRAPPTAPARQAPVPVRDQTPPRAQPQPQAEPDWADGAGTPLSAYALRREDAQPFDPAHLPRTHRVGENKSLYDIATRYQAPLRALIDQNHLEPPYALAPGAELVLPPPRLHRVARGETFEEVARRYNVDLRSLALLNRMQAPYVVRAGDQIVLPATARDDAALLASSSPAPSATPTARASQTAAVERPAAGARFAWPLRGDIVARFGAQPGGAQLDGVEIAGREGATIAAAAEGDVVYAGSDLPAYGTLVLVRHADNYVTAYGFARRALVREGQHVGAGQAIAELGPKPDGRPRLLFQVRHGGEAVDPAPLLGIGD